MTALECEEFSRTEQAGLLARAALAIAAERMGGRPPDPFVANENALRANVIQEVKRRLKIAPDDLSDEALRKIEDALDAEMEAVADPVDVEAALARTAALVTRAVQASDVTDRGADSRRLSLFERVAATFHRERSGRRGVRDPVTPEEVSEGTTKKVDDTENASRKRRG